MLMPFCGCLLFICLFVCLNSQVSGCQPRDDHQNHRDGLLKQSSNPILEIAALEGLGQGAKICMEQLLLLLYRPHSENKESDFVIILQMGPKFLIVPYSISSFLPSFSPFLLFFLCFFVSFFQKGEKKVTPFYIVLTFWQAWAATSQVE